MTYVPTGPVMPRPVNVATPLIAMAEADPTKNAPVEPAVIAAVIVTAEEEPAVIVEPPAS